ncbi:MAG: hypothetical protein R3F37_13450 [Candidatus Competibacteraceae bacterium]
MVSVTNTNAWAKPGVMIRGSLHDDARHAMVAVTPSNGVARTTGGSSARPAGANVTAPYWVKLERAGNTLYIFQSADGSTWTLIGSSISTWPPACMLAWR